MNARLAQLAFIVALHCGFATTSAVELVVNGSFESTTCVEFVQTTVYAGDSTSITAWTVGGDSIDDHSNAFWQQADLVLSNHAYDGAHAVDLDGSSTGSISQSFPTTPGQAYRLSFAHSRNVYHPEIYAAPTSAAQVSVAGSRNLLTYAFSSSLPGPQLIWTPVSLTFFADSNSTTLKFESTDSPGYLGGVVIDAVSVTPTTAYFAGLGNLPGGSGTFAFGVSADGNVAVGWSGNANPAASEAFRWTRAGGMVSLGFLPDGDVSIANAASADGSVIVGWGESAAGRQAFRWTQPDGMAGLSGIPPTFGENFANAVSSDGSVVVGYAREPQSSRQQAFRWTEAGGMVGLGYLPGGDVPFAFSSANGVSADGSVVAGESIYPVNPFSYGIQASRWTQTSGMVGLGFLPGGFRSSASAISADGTVIVGVDEVTFDAFRWTEVGGMQGLGLVLGGNYSEAKAVSADGSTIVGVSDRGAFIWSRTLGMRLIQDILTIDYGFDLTNWSLQAATGVSADGLTIVGYGGGPSMCCTEAWIAHLMPTLDVEMDIRPGDCPNSLNRNSHGVLPVALLGSSDFDVSQVNCASLRLRRADGVGQPVAPHESPPGPHSVISDVATPFDGATCGCNSLAGDGRNDLLLHFKVDELTAQLELNGLDSGALVQLVLSGTRTDGQPFKGADCIRLVPAGAGNATLRLDATPAGWLDVSPLDLNLDGGGFGRFERRYPETAVITLTAPGHTPDGRAFAGWRINGILSSSATPQLRYVMPGTDGDISADYAPASLSDLNCDGRRDGRDVAAFALALLDPAGYSVTYPSCPLANRDFDSDNQVTSADVPGFTQNLLGL